MPSPRPEPPPGAGIATSASDGLLLLKTTPPVADPPPPPPSQPNKVKPFILRSTSPRASGLRGRTRGASASLDRIVDSLVGSPPSLTISATTAAPRAKSKSKASSRIPSRLPHPAGSLHLRSDARAQRSKSPAAPGDPLAPALPIVGSKEQDRGRKLESVHRRGDRSLGDVTNRTPERSRAREEVDGRKPPSLSPEKRRPTAAAPPAKPHCAASRKEYDSEDDEPTDEPGYRSMQDMLELSGFTDTRVITPVAHTRRPKRLSLGSTLPPTPSTTPPLRPTTLRAKPSLLSLALSSFWPRSTPAAPQADRATSPAVESDQAISDGEESDSTVTCARRQRAQAWVASVAQETRDVSCSPTATLVSHADGCLSLSQSPTPTLASFPQQYIISPSSSLRPCPPTPPSRNPSLTQPALVSRKSSDPVISDVLAVRTLRHALSSPDLHPTAPTPSVIFQSFALPPPPPTRSKMKGIQYGEPGSESPPRNPPVSRVVVDGGSTGGWTESLLGFSFDFKTAVPPLRTRASEAILGWRSRAKKLDERNRQKDVPRLLRKGSALLRPSPALAPVLTSGVGVGESWKAEV